MNPSATDKEEPHGAAIVRPPVPTVSFDELPPEIRAILLQQIDENNLLSNALTGLRDRIEELERLVDSDTLTPLPNRRRFVRELERVIEHNKRYGTIACVMFVDLDGLKAINDGHGHLAGDAALVQVANTLSSLLRKTDLVARIGGDEFGLLLEALDIDAAEEKAARLIEAIVENPIEVGGKLIPLNISVGIAELTADDSPESILKRADLAMYARRSQSRSAR